MGLQLLELGDEEAPAACEGGTVAPREAVLSCHLANRADLLWTRRATVMRRQPGHELYYICKNTMDIDHVGANGP